MLSTLFGNFFRHKPCEEAKETEGEKLLAIIGKHTGDPLRTKLLSLRRDIKMNSALGVVLDQEQRQWRRAKKPLGTDLNTDIILARREQRARFLAYGFLRSKRYSQIEENPRWKKAPYDKEAPNWDKVADFVIAYGYINTNAVTASEYRTARKELLEQLRRWAGN